MVLPLHQKRPLRALQIVALSAIMVALVWFRVSWAPDSFFLVLLAIFVILGLGKSFMIRFLPFVILLMSYDSLRGFADVVNKHVHYVPMIHFDKWLTGVEPNVWLQQHLYHGVLHWYDFYFYSLYMLHFVVPLLVAVAIWRLRPQNYWRFVVSFLLLSYAGFITYLLFPAAPPWMASQHGYIQHIDKLGDVIWLRMGIHSVPTLYSQINPNAVAAMPSLHAAYPVLMWLTVRQQFSWKVWVPFTLYPLSMSFGVIYLGEHYLADVVAGWAFAFAAFGATALLCRRLQAPHRRHRPLARLLTPEPKPSVVASSR